MNIIYLQLPFKYISEIAEGNFKFKKDQEFKVSNKNNLGNTVFKKSLQDIKRVKESML